MDVARKDEGEAGADSSRVLKVNGSLAPLYHAKEEDDGCVFIFSWNYRILKKEKVLPTSPRESRSSTLLFGFPVSSKLCGFSARIAFVFSASLLLSSIACCNI